GRDRRLADDVEAEERRGSVQVHRGQHEEAPGDGDGGERARGGEARTEEPDGEPRGEVGRSTEEERAEEEGPVASGEALRGDGDDARGPVATEPVANQRAG